MLSTRLFGKTTDLKLKAVTIIHSSTTETVRLPPDSDGANVVVHPAAVRSKLPLKRRVHEAGHRRRLKAAANKKNKVLEPSKPTEKPDDASTPSPRKVQKKVIAKKKKPLKIKKKKKEIIDYSAAQEKSSGKTPEEDPLGKVRNWLLNSHNIAGSLSVRKSKSSPAGFLQPDGQPRSPVKVHRPVTRPTEHRGKSGSFDSNGKEQVKLQVVYKPPFKFSVKIKKPSEVATTVVKEINSKVNQRSRNAILIRNDKEHKQNHGKRKSRPTSGENAREHSADPTSTNQKIDSEDIVDGCRKHKEKEKSMPEVKTAENKENSSTRLILTEKCIPVYENTPLYQNTHELLNSTNVPDSCPKVDLLRMSSVECVSQSQIPLPPEKCKPQKITRHHSVDGNSQGNVLLRDEDRKMRRDSSRDSRKRYSLATDKYIDPVRYSHSDKVHNHSERFDPVSMKKCSVPLIDSDVDSNLHTVPSDMEVLLSESEYLFSDA